MDKILTLGLCLWTFNVKLSNKNEDLKNEFLACNLKEDTFIFAANIYDKNNVFLTP